MGAQVNHDIGPELLLEPQVGGQVLVMGIYGRVVIELHGIV